MERKSSTVYITHRFLQINNKMHANMAVIKGPFPFNFGANTKLIYLHHLFRSI